VQPLAEVDGSQCLDGTLAPSAVGDAV